MHCELSSAFGRCLRPSAALVAGLSLTISAAWAAPGEHIRSGDVTVTPDIDIGMEYRTNVYRKEADPVPAANMALSPGLTMSVANPLNAFRIGADWEMKKFFFVGSDGLDQSAQIRALDQYNEFGVDAEVEALKQEVVGLKITDKMALRNNNTDAEFSDAPYVTQYRNVLGGGLRVSPGPALGIVAGADWAYDDYRSPDAADREFNRRNTYGPTLTTKWDFFPRTAFVFNGEYMWYRWAENTIPAGNVNEFELNLANSRHFKFDLGIKGRFSEKVFADVMLGYGFALYDADSLATTAAGATENLTGGKGIRANVQARYQMIENLGVAAGYKRDFTDSFFTNYIVYDNIYGQLQANVANIRPSVRYSARFEDYAGTSPFQGEALARNDILMRFDFNLAYDIKEWAAITGGVGWQQRSSQPNPLVEYDDVRFRFLATFTY